MIFKCQDHVEKDQAGSDSQNRTAQIFLCTHMHGKSSPFIKSVQNDFFLLLHSSDNNNNKVCPLFKSTLKRYQQEHKQASFSYLPFYLCGGEVFNKSIKEEWVLNLTNICPRTKQVETIFICPDLQKLLVPFLQQKQDTKGSVFTISKDLARNVEQLKNT